LRKRNLLLILIVIASVLMISGTLMGYFLYKTEEEKETDLRVDDVIFQKVDMTQERSRIEIVIFITNTGEEDAGSISVRAFSVETSSNLAMDDSSITINDVRHKQTVEGTLEIDVPNREFYRVELLIFLEDRLEIVGSGTMDLTDVGVATEYETRPSGGGGVDDSGEPGASIVDEGGAASVLCLLFILGSLAFIAVVVIIAAAASRSAGGKREEEPPAGNGPVPARAPPIHKKLDDFELMPERTADQEGP